MGIIWDSYRIPIGFLQDSYGVHIGIQIGFKLSFSWVQIGCKWDSDMRSI